MRFSIPAFLGGFIGSWGLTHGSVGLSLVGAGLLALGFYQAWKATKERKFPTPS